MTQEATPGPNGNGGYDESSIQQLEVVVWFTWTLWPQFLSGGNIAIMSKHVAQNALLAIGMTFVILTGGRPVGRIARWADGDDLRHAN